MSYWNTIGRLNVEHEVLHDGHLVKSKDDLQSRGCHLGQYEQIQTDCINLQMSPLSIPNDRESGFACEFGMNAVRGGEVVLEPLNLVRLTCHCCQKAAHTFNAWSLQFVGLGAILVVVRGFLVRQTECPDSKSGVDVIPDPCMTILILGYQTSNGILNHQVWKYILEKKWFVGFFLRSSRSYYLMLENCLEDHPGVDVKLDWGFATAPHLVCCQNWKNFLLFCHAHSSLFWSSTNYLFDLLWHLFVDAWVKVFLFSLYTVLVV